MKKKILPFTRFEEKSINFKNKSPEDFSWKIYLLPIIIVLVFLILTSRLFQLTIVKGAYYRFLAENNRIKEIKIEPLRGRILDRKGMVLAYSQKKGDLVKRVYPEGEFFGHILGYRQLASKEEIKNDLCENSLELNDKVGKMGIEKIFDCQLRGKKGKKLVETDALGKEIKTINIATPVPGKDIKISLDAQLQIKAAELLKNKKGAVVASIPQTGEILILFSSPTFNPQVFEDNDLNLINSYLKNKTQPLFNRATKGLYPPGSVIKPIISVAALEEKIIDSRFQIEDTGIIKAGPLTFGNWYFLQYGKTDGMVDVVKAIKRSNDIFFYRLGEKMGEKKIKAWLEKFGFGKKTNLGLEEEEGLIPSSFWKKETLKENWYLGDTYNLSIGQGYFLATPIQINLTTAVFANEDYLCQPQLLKIQKLDLKTQNCQKLHLSPKNLALVKEGMKQACSPGGTGWPLFNFKIKNQKINVNNKEDYKEEEIQTGCKTGTAESQDKDKNPHAWFTIFAPFEKPEIVITVLVEHGGQGSDIAAPIAKEILKVYFERRE